MCEQVCSSFLFVSIGVVRGPPWGLSALWAPKDWLGRVPSCVMSGGVSWRVVPQSMKTGHLGTGNQRAHHAWSCVGVRGTSPFLPWTCCGLDNATRVVKCLELKDKILCGGASRTISLQYSFPNLIKTQDPVDTFLRRDLKFTRFLVWLLGAVTQQVEIRCKEKSGGREERRPSPGQIRKGV